MTALDSPLISPPPHTSIQQTLPAPSWHARPSGLLTASQRRWLYRPGALTAGLRQLGRVELRVTAEFSTGLTPNEARALRQPAGSPVWIREVMMAIDGQDCVSARSVTPLQASNGVWSGMRRLRTRPLADMLYGNPAIIRSRFEWRQLALGDPFWQAVQRRGLAMPNRAIAPLLARRSVFWRAGQPLLVAECFLPAFWQAAQSASSQLSRRPPGTTRARHCPTPSAPRAATR